MIGVRVGVSHVVQDCYGPVDFGIEIQFDFAITEKERLLHLKQQRLIRFAGTISPRSKLDHHMNGTKLSRELLGVPIFPDVRACSAPGSL